MHTHTEEERTRVYIHEQASTSFRGMKLTPSDALIDGEIDRSIYRYTHRGRDNTHVCTHEQVCTSFHEMKLTSSAALPAGGPNGDIVLPAKPCFYQYGLFP